MSDAIPTHVAFIPDGNRRWARAENLTTFDGHSRGVTIFRDIVSHAADRGIKTISLWGMSRDNFSKRSPREVADLVSIFEQEFTRMLTDKDIHGKNIRVRIFGARHLLPGKLRNAVKAIEEATAHYSNYAMNIFLAYNGTDEMIQAVQSIVETGYKRITANIIKQNLLTKDLPPVDFLIRTGGEPHLSAGFMMWDIADAELYFTKTLWPAFTVKELDIALQDYATRRRLGGA